MPTRQDPAARIDAPRSGPEPPAPREAQRRRTRLAIVDATQRLLQDGRTPSIDDIATTADVSRRTIYMYFPTLDQLVLDAAVGLLSSAEVDAALDSADGEDVRDRVDALVRAVLDTAPEALPLGRQIIRLTVDGTDVDTDSARRGQRRVEWLVRALEPIRPDLDAEQFDRLVSGLAVVIGWEAMTVLQDVRGLDADAEHRVTTWAARALVDAMLAEVEQGKAAR